jgi:hypothetical protein|tara:strand:+ start:651 stop:866 length:216 start_codon:yes stop_codon:yes gene_type:complete
MQENIKMDEAIRYMVDQMSPAARIEFAMEMFPAGEKCLDLEGQVVIYTEHYEDIDSNRIKFTDEDERDRTL